MQETYGLNIDRMGVDYSHTHAAICMQQLPSSSRLAKALNVENEWREDTYFLAAIEYDLRVLAWQNTKDAQKNKNKPKPHKTPSDYAKDKARKNDFDKDLVKEVLGGGD